MKRKKIIRAALLSLLLMSVATLLCYERLPQQIPLHWGIDGTADGYGSKNDFLLMMYGMLLFINALGLCLPAIDPRRQNYQRFSKAYEITFYALDLLVLLLFGAAIFTAFQPQTMRHWQNGDLFLIAMGAVFTVIGNYMPRFRQNFFIGIKTPWALANETVWNRTHRVGGRCWFISGLLFILTAFLPAFLRPAMLIVSFTLMVAIPLLYSYLFYRKIVSPNQKGE